MKFKSAALALATVAAVGVAAAPAMAQSYGGYAEPYAGSDDRYDDRYSDDRYADDRYGDDRYDDRRYDDRAYSGYGQRYDRRTYDRYNRTGYHASCRDQRSDRGVAGGVIGALAGAALGSNIADRNVRSEGAVLGAVVGGVLGSQIGRSSACDADGYYYSYNQTHPYRVSSGYRGRYRDYGNRGCRLAIAETRYGRSEYVTVCPDRYGRYRVVGY